MEKFEKSVSQPNQKKTAIIYCRDRNNDKITKQRFICVRYCYANNIFIEHTVLDYNGNIFLPNVPRIVEVETLIEKGQKIDYLIVVEGTSIQTSFVNRLKSLGTELICVPSYDPILENKDTAIIYMTVDKGATNEEISKQKLRYLEYCRYNSIRILEFVVDNGEDNLFSGVIKTIEKFNSGPSKLITNFIYNDCFKESMEFTPNMFESFGIKTLCIDDCDSLFIEGYHSRAGKNFYFGYNLCTFSKEDFAETHAEFMSKEDFAETHVASISCDNDFYYSENGNPDNVNSSNLSHPKKTAIIYCGSRAKNNGYINVRQEICINYCHEKYIEVYDTIFDNEFDISLDRPGLQKIMELVKNQGKGGIPRIDYLICDCPSTFFSPHDLNDPEKVLTRCREVTSHGTDFMYI